MTEEKLAEDQKNFAFIGMSSKGYKQLPGRRATSGENNMKSIYYSVLV